MLAIGTVLGGRLRIDEILGAGGMGIVAAATHLELGHRVAIKFLRDEMAGNPTVVDRFLREARAVVKLRTEHVCRVTDVGRTDSGAPYIVMELLEGTDLQRVVANRPLPPALAVTYVVQACVALAEAHAAGIIHRDLKPANLFVTRRLDGTPLLKVLDFGIAKALAETGAHLTHTQGAMGSPGYMSPEQLQSARDVDPRTDIWALGVTLYQLLAARLPFTGATMAEIAVKVATDAPAPLPEVDPQLRAIVWRCLEKAQDRRYPDVVTLSTELAPFGGGASAVLLPTIQAFAYRAGSFLTAPTAPSARPSPNAPTQATAAETAPRPRSRWPVIAAALVVLAIAAGITVAKLHDAPAPVHALADAAPIVAAVVRVDAAAPDAGSDDSDETADLFGGMPDVQAALSQSTQLMKAQCKQVRGKTDPSSAMLDLMCACMEKDAVRARTVWPRVKLERDAMRQTCEIYGVKLP